MIAQRSVLPNLVIAGFSKAGTTSLFAMLRGHHDVHPSSTKETRFFQPLRYGEPLPPIDTYARYFTGYTGQALVMECTPDYVYGGDATARVIRDTCNPRILLIARDPTMRALSFFRFLRARLQLPADLDFDAYVDRCLSLPDAVMHRRDMNPWTGVWGGRYGDFVEPWFTRYGDRCRLVFFEDLVAYPQQVASSLFDWLGVADVDVTLRSDNASVDYRSAGVQRAAARLARLARPVLHFHPRLTDRARRAYARVNEREVEPEPVSPETSARLGEHYRSSITRMRDLMTARGVVDLPSWLSPAHR